jgi:hypothetical protein
VSAAGATIGGVIIKGAAAWAIQPGTAPFQTVVHVDRDALPDPTRLMGRSKPQRLVVEGVGGRWEVDGVFVVDYAPAGDPYNWALTLADRRYWWPRDHILRRYNIRRRTGSMRLLTEGHPVLVPEAVSDFGYELATLLSPGKRWEPLDALKDVLTILDGSAPDHGVTARTVPMDDVELDDDGASAVTRLLRQMPGTNCYVSAAGQTALFDETDRAAAEQVLRAMGSPVVGKGIAAGVVYAAIRPKGINALLTVEQEVKFTSLQDGTSYSTRGSTAKYMENVMEVTDLSLTLTTGRVVARGTWITVQEAIDAFGGISGTNADGKAFSFPKLTVALIRQLWFSNFRNYIGAAASVAGVDWVQRIASIQKHFRQTYRISPYWMNRIRVIRAERVAIIDTENGTRAPAFVTQNYAINFNQRGMNFASQNQGIVVNTTNAYNDSLPLAKAAPFSVSILNMDLGILHLSAQTDMQGYATSFLPSALEATPQMAPSLKDKNPWTDGTVLQGANPAMLAETHRVAIVLTCVPSAPNSNDQLFRVKVTPSDVESSFSLPVGACDGPEWEVRIGPGIATARFAWNDDFEDLIDKSFGVPTNPTPGVRPTYKNGDALAAANLLVDAKEVKDLAKAAAASIWSQMTDRVVGTQAGPADDSLHPTGNATIVVHGIDGDGAINSLVRFDRISGRLDVAAFLSNDVRRKLMRMVQA